jgi:hypothetical protein
MGCGVVGEEESGGGTRDADDHDVDLVRIAALKEGKQRIGEARGRHPLPEEQECCHGVWRLEASWWACGGGAADATFCR